MRDGVITEADTCREADRLQADVSALKAGHAAIRETNAAPIPATLERTSRTEAIA